MPLAIPLIIAGVGYGISAIGKIKAGNAAARAGEFNAQALETQAFDAEARGADESSRFRSQVRGMLGAQRTAFAGQNVRVGEGSPVDVAADTTYLGELDAQQIEQNARREAWGYRQDATSSRMGGQAAQSASRWGAAADVLGGTSSILLSKYGWDRTSGRTPRPGYR